MPQFAFLTAEFPEIFAHASKAESLALSDPRAACFYVRLALETAVNWLYAHDPGLKNPYERTLAARIHEPTFVKLVGPALATKARIIKDHGNTAVHETRPVAPATAVTALREFFHVAYWLTHTYAKGAKPDPGLAFSPDALRKTTLITTATLQQLRDIAQRFDETEKARAVAEQLVRASEAERARIEAELAEVRAEIAAVKQANAAIPDTHDYDEAATRDAFIDLLLHEAGWPLDQKRDREFRVTGMPNAAGEGYADYVLWGDDGKPLGLVEAKRTRHDARIGQQQAKLYADCLEQMFGQRPVIFYTNGYEHWIWDDSNAPPREIQGFLGKDELHLLIQRRTTRRPLAPQDIDGGIVERYYQTRAIRRVGEAFERDGQRKALLVMATGSGKTRTVIALCDLLMRANWVKRVLFLADRVALVNQAVNAFKKHLPSVSPVNLVTEKDPGATGRVYVSTYPTMMRLIDETEDGKRRFGVGHFDLVVIDEAHRSVYRKYGAIFDYFDSYLVGLTATPKDEVDRDTYRLFQLQRGVPTDAYSLDEAVQDGWLVPPQAYSVPLRFVRQGIRYDDLSDEEKEEWDAIEWDDDGGVPAQVEAGEINKWLFNADTVDKVLLHLMQHGLKVESGDRLGKTIIFAKGHDHAEFIVRRFDLNYPNLKGDFAQVIDNQVTYAQSLIDKFSQPNKMPHIAVSVDMLDTGIDVPEVVNLVFFKIVRSKTKFWQMLGRGTRLCPDLFGPGQHKDGFAVFDFCQNFEFFNQNPPRVDPPIPESLSQRLFVRRVELVGEIDHRREADDALRGLRADTAERLREEVAAMSLDNFLVRPKRAYVEKYARPDAWTTLTLQAQTELIHDVAGLPSALTDDDTDAKGFDLLVLRTQLALLRGDDITAMRETITGLAGALEAIQNIPAVAAQLELILEIQSDEYWQDITPPLLEAARRKLRGLMKLIEFQRRKPVYTNFVDQIGVAESVSPAPLPPMTDEARFRAKVRHFLKAHEDHITIQKLRRNEALTPTDLDELERIFAQSGIGTEADIAKIRADGGLGLFIRSLVGLDQAAAKRAFGSFMQGRTLTANQHELINMIIEHLTQRGTMNPELLYESPFTDLAPSGVEGVFGEAEVVQLVNILDDVRRRAAA